MLIPFKVRFERHFIPEPNSGCWLWESAQINNGYGVLKDADGNNKLAHRASYELYKGIIPKGLVLDHLCRNRLCVNPDHLEAVTQKINIARGNLPNINGKKNREKTECIKGHSYSGDNLHIRPSGHRTCKECARVRSREFKRKKRVRA